MCDTQCGPEDPPVPMRLIRPMLPAIVCAAMCAGMPGCTAFDPRAVAPAPEITPDHIERAKRILASNDPRQLKAGAVQAVEVSAADADLALNYLAHRYADGGAEAHFEPRRAHIRAGGRVAALPWRPYVSFELDLV